MELLQLKYFKAVAESGHITNTAESLFISPPALSASIRRLEQDLGVRLFDRTNKSICLNKQGEIFLHYVNHLLVTLDSARLDVARSRSHENERISVAAAFNNSFVDLICAFNLEYPQIIISHSTINLLQISGGELPPQYDFLLAAENDLESENLLSTELFEDQLAVMVYPSHPFADRSSIDLREVIEETLFAPVAEQSLRRMLNKTLNTAGLKAERIIEASYMVCRSMVLAKRGISISNVLSGKAESDPCLRYIPIEKPFYRWKQMLYWRNKPDPSHAEILFRDFTVDYCKTTS